MKERSESGVTASEDVAGSALTDGQLSTPVSTSDPIPPAQANNALTDSWREHHSTAARPSENPGRVMPVSV